MMHPVAIRKACWTVICGMTLPLATIGCQHTHTATTEVATTSVSTSVEQAPKENGNGFAQGSRQTYHAAANGVREVGSSVADMATNSIVKVRNTPPESLTAPVIDVDEAMQVRDWDQVTATYSSGTTVAGPIGFMDAPRPGQNQWRYQFIDTPLFLGNTALLPFAFAKTPPWAPVEWKAATVEPTYTGVPPLPPE